MQAWAAIFEQELTSKICYSDNIPDKKIKIKQLLFVKVKKKKKKKKSFLSRVEKYFTI